jgi:hypothetical protein
MDTGTGSGNDTGVDVWQNAFNVPANYGLSKLDTRNTINGSATYELPFGIGKSFALAWHHGRGARRLACYWCLPDSQRNSLHPYHIKQWPGSERLRGKPMLLWILVASESSGQPIGAAPFDQ